MCELLKYYRHGRWLVVAAANVHYQLTNMNKILTLHTNITPIYAKTLEEFNSYVEKYKAPYEMILTKGNNISQANLRNMPCCKTWKRGNHMEFHYIDCKIRLRVIYALHYDEEANTSESVAYDALNYFKGCMDLIPTDAKEENTELFTCKENPNSSYYNYVDNRYVGITNNNCYSLDRNNSFPASMKTVYPETAPFVDKYYKERLIKKQQYKDGLITAQEWNDFKVYGSIFVGWLKNAKYHREHAWKKIISDSNHIVDNLRKYIESKGHQVLLVNTDAVKFIGEVDYKESTDLGQFKYEWKNAKMYIKGVKSYAYNEGDKWKFKQAGKCLLDKIKPREEWTFDDFKYGPTEAIKEIVIVDNKLMETYK